MGASIVEVSERAGVSRMTVSRVMRGQTSVSVETRRLVLKAVEELGCVPSANARAMRSKDALLATGSLCCGLIFGGGTKTADSFFSTIAQAAEEEAAKHGLSLLQSHWEEDFALAWPRLRAMFGVSGMCGAVLAGQFKRKEIQAIGQYTRNIVILDGPAPAGGAIASVEGDYFAGSVLAIDHLVGGGAKNILVITGPYTQHYFAKAMTAAAKSEVRSGVKVEVMCADMTPQSGYEIVKKMCNDGMQFDGIFCNDELAIGALRALAEMKVRVPKDVKVVGFDDIAHAAFTNPSLTTVSIDKAQIGREAVNTLVSIVRGKVDEVNMKKVVKANLVIRESA